MTHRDPATQVRPKCDPDAPKMALSDRDPATPSIGRGRGSRLLQPKSRPSQAAHRDPEGRSPTMTERELLDAVRDACRWSGLLVYHTHDSRRSERGFPDLVLVGPAGVIFRELKAERGRLTLDQREWLDRLRQAGAAAAVWRPRDWPSRVLAELAGIGGRCLPATGSKAAS